MSGINPGPISESKTTANSAEERVFGQVLRDILITYFALNIRDQISEILASILRTGLLRIRNQGGLGTASQCSLEADHLHNLPYLILRPEWDLLNHYFNIDRTAFLSEAVNVEQFSEDWNRLRIILDGQARQESKDLR